MAIVSFFFYPGKKEEEEGELINSRGKHAFFLDEPVNASNFRRSCPPINPRSACSSIYQFIGIDIDSNAREGEGRPSQIRAEKAAHKADVTARNLTRRVPTSAIRLAEPDSHGENEVRDENERAKTMPLRHASTHARTQQRVHALGEPSHLLNYAPATCTEMRFNRCRLSARRSLAFSMLATRYQVMAANNHVRITAFSKRESTNL